MPKTAVGFIGLGIMGGPMAGRLLAAGHPLTVHTRTAARAASLGEQGAAIAGSPAEVARRSEAIVVMVPDTPDVERVVEGPEGLLEGIRPGSVVIDMSTIAPAAERRLQARLSERGADLVDAPVSGGDVGAREGTLAIMAGGAPEAVERVRPILALMGRTITHCGPIGSGQTAKLCNQILVAVTLLGVSEALTLARKSGLEPGTLLDAVAKGAAGSWQLTNLGPRIAARDFAPGFMIDLMQKDLRLVLDTARQARATLPATALVEQLFRACQARGEGREGTQALAKTIEMASGVMP